MIQPLWGQGLVFLFTVLLGAAVGLLYDIFRAIRKNVPHNAIVIFIEDIIFCAGATFFVFYFMFAQNYGEIRPFSLIGIAGGAILYFVTVSKIFLPFLSKILELILKVALWPFRFIAKTILPPLNKLLRRVKVYGRIQRKKLRSHRKGRELLWKKNKKKKQKK